MSLPNKLDTRKAAQYLSDIGVDTSPGTLEVWRCLGKGPRYFKIGRMVRYHADDLARFAQGQVVETVDSISARQCCAEAAK